MKFLILSLFISLSFCSTALDEQIIPQIEGSLDQLEVSSWILQYVRGMCATMAMERCTMSYIADYFGLSKSCVVTFLNGYKDPNLPKELTLTKEQIQEDINPMTGQSYTAEGTVAAQSLLLINKFQNASYRVSLAENFIDDDDDTDYTDKPNAFLAEYGYTSIARFVERCMYTDPELGRIFSSRYRYDFILSNSAIIAHSATLVVPWAIPPEIITGLEEAKAFISENLADLDNTDALLQHMRSVVIKKLHNITTDEYGLFRSMDLLANELGITQGSIQNYIEKTGVCLLKKSTQY